MSEQPVVKPSLHVATVRSNVKGAREFNLQPRTIVVGENAHGKSALVLALKLALEGEDPDYGRTPAELMLLAPPNVEALTVEASIADADGQVRGTSRWSTSGSSEKAKKPEWKIDGGLGKPPGTIRLADGTVVVLSRKKN